MAKLAQAEKLALAKMAAAERQQQAELQAGRGVWEAFGVSRDKAHLLNMGFGGVFFLSSAVYIVSGMLHGFQTFGPS